MESVQEKSWLCLVCGYVHRGPAPPEECPVCGASSSEFEEQVETEKTSSTGKSFKWQCTVCDYIHDGQTPPETCPVCGATADFFEKLEDQPEKFIPEKKKGKVVIIGAGIAGLSAAEAIRKASLETPIILVSKENHLPYYRLNLTRFLAGEIGEKDLEIHSQDWYRQNQFDLLLGIEALEIDLDASTVRYSNRDTESFDQLILTAGAQTFIPPLPGVDREGVIGLRTLEDAHSILERALKGASCVCIGGGLLGLETAGALARRGCDVALVESFPWLMPRQLDQKGGQLLQHYIEELGIKLYTNARIAELSGDRQVSSVLLQDGTAIKAGMVLMTAGIRPDCDLARRAGLVINRGVVVNDFLKTSHPGIFAAGDIAEHKGVLYGLWNASQYQGTIAGMNAAGVATEFGGMPRSSALKVVGLDVVSLGEVEIQNESYRAVEEEKEGKYTRFLFHDSHLVGTQMIGHIDPAGAAKKAIEDRRDFSSVLRPGGSVKAIVEFLQ